ncbi:hypothetical protein AMC83_CH00571 [Rhizobium phaseoli]|uniref:hypothetical protein n=1 Tax=Rhizobium phaseoli TaxID=396 RepID=UPI0007E96170|nr:hypothetical protein [Rhizobium phaseoli]ANL70605.1 hypothetical protein AMC83_CH00571 [Rhizobium phaseoli]
MKALVTDSDAILSLSPLSVVGYLRARGWIRYSETPGKFSVWINDAAPDAEIVIPYKRVSDFLSLLKNVLSELEIAEGRSQLEIIRDLLNAGFDVVRLAAKSQSTSGGSVKIDEGLTLFEQAREILMAAACATVNPRAVFHARKPQRAVDYIDNARLGQTEHGSYVLTLLSPVTPQLNPYSETDLFPGEPFERQVVRTLARSIGLTVDAAAEASATGSFEPFQSAVSGGVSANLCEAVTRLFKVGDPASIAVSVAWAQNRPLPSDTPSQILISQDVVPAISEAARLFRATDTLSDYLVQGPVVKLERQDGEPNGRVTIYAPIDDIMRKVVVTLPAETYDKATIAHREYRPVRVRGNVTRAGRSFVANDPIGFDFASEEDEIEP